MANKYYLGEILLCPSGTSFQNNKQVWRDFSSRAGAQALEPLPSALAQESRIAKSQLPFPANIESVWGWGRV